jgi:hypothetical protein
MNDTPNKSEVLGLQWRTALGNIAYAYGKEIDLHGYVRIHGVSYCENLREWMGRVRATVEHVGENRIQVDLPEIDNLQSNIEQAVRSIGGKGIELI